MQIFQSIAASALLVAAMVEAKVAFTKMPSDAQVGQAVTISWADAQGPVTILLKKGDSNDLKTVATLTSNASGNEFTWTPSEDLAEGSDYALEIDSAGEVNYSPQFPVKGGKAPEPTVSTSSSAV
ncbi:hypothetical protein KEM52_004448, partial [Ascosphaera acerosa]